MKNKKFKLFGIERAEYYENGAMKNCTLSQKNELVTALGSYVPQYGPETERSRYVPSVVFYESSALKSIALDN